MFEFYQLRYFLAVVETGSFTKAAERACVTQPTLSAGIKKLETALGAKLFHRSSRRVHLTEAGTRFVDRAKTILFACSRAAEDMREAPVTAHLRLGILRTLPSALVARLVRDFRREWGETIITIIEGTEQELANRLDGGGVDMAVTLVRADSKNAISLFEEDYRLMMPPTHPLAGEGVVDGRVLGNEAMVVRTRCEALSEVSRYFTDRNVRPRLVYRTDHDERALEMVAGNVGLTVAPACYRHAGVISSGLAGFERRRTVGLIQAEGAGADQDDAASRFMAFITSQDWSGTPRLTAA